MDTGDLTRSATLWGWIILAGMFLGIAVYPPKNSGEVASWVQGVGTIAAIVVTAWVGLAPLRHAEAERRAAKQSFNLALRDAIEWSDDLLAGSIDHLRNGRDAEARSELWKTRITSPGRPLQHMLNHPLTEWPSADAFSFSHAYLNCVQQMVEAGEAWGIAGERRSREQPGRPWEEAARETEEREAREGFILAVDNLEQTRARLNLFVMGLRHRPAPVTPPRPCDQTAELPSAE